MAGVPEYVISLGWTLPMPGDYGNVKPVVTVPYVVRPGETEGQAFQRAFERARWQLMAATYELANGYAMAVHDPKGFAEAFLRRNPVCPGEPTVPAPTL